jgi:hypothetical protein
VLLRSSLFLDVIQRWLVVNYRRFRTAYRSHLQRPSCFDCLTFDQSTLPNIKKSEHATDTGAEACNHALTLVWLLLRWLYLPTVSMGQAPMNPIDFSLYWDILWARGGALGWGSALQARRSRVQFPMVSLDFFINIILPAAPWPWGRLSLKQKLVPIIFPGNKGGRCVELTTLPPSCADCLEIWEPQTPGTLRACAGL